MKRLSGITLAILMLLTVLAPIAMAENNTSATIGNGTITDAVEIRGPVYNGTSLTDIIANQGANGAITMNADKFAAFFYDIDNNITTETLSIKAINDTSGRTIGEGGLVYSTTIGQTEYKYTKDADSNTVSAWGSYSVLGFFADKYIPINPNDASKLAKLVLDSDDKYTLKTGNSLDLGSGYSLIVKQVDVNGQKVWIELDYNGQRVDDSIIATDSGDHTWTCKLDKIQDEDNVVVLKVHVNQVFQGAEDSIAQVDGLWLIDFENTIKLTSDEAFGKLDNVALNGKTITIDNKDTFTLTRDSDIEIGNGLYFKVADADALRFYAYKHETSAGTYNIRGTVATGVATWDASNFAGFFYDLKKDVSTESLKVSNLADRTVPENGLTYSTTIENVDYKYTTNADTITLPAWGSYPVIGFMAKEYVPISANDASKLSKLVLDNDDKYTLKAGDNLALGSGYSLQVKQVDIDGKKAWLELAYNGQSVDDAIIDVSTGDHTWQCKIDDVLGTTDVYVMKLHVNQVFQGAESSVVQIDGLWLIDFRNAFEINTDDSFGKFDSVSINGGTITLNNKDSFTLTRDTEKLDINGQGMNFKVADSDELRYYPYIEEIIGNGTTVTTTTNVPSEPSVITPAPVVNEPQNVTENTTENVTAPVVVETPVTTVVETPVEPVANNTTTEPSTPGFGIVPAIIGLLIVVYFVRKNI